MLFLLTIEILSVGGEVLLGLIGNYLRKHIHLSVINARIFIGKLNLVVKDVEASIRLEKSLKKIGRSIN